MSQTGSSSVPLERESDPLPEQPSEPLLRTKLFVPPARSNQIARPRLLELLNAGLDRALILVSAPGRLWENHPAQQLAARNPDFFSLALAG